MNKSKSLSILYETSMCLLAVLAFILASSLWWAFVTVTTVGYGDLSPATPTGRIIASILMIVGIGLIGSLTSTITSYFFNKKQAKTYKDHVIEGIKEQLDHMDTLTEEDIDTIAAVLKTIKNKNFTSSSTVSDNDLPHEAHDQPVKEQLKNEWNIH